MEDLGARPLPLTEARDGAAAGLPVVLDPATEELPRPRVLVEIVEGPAAALDDAASLPRLVLITVTSGSRFRLLAFDLGRAIVGRAVDETVVSVESESESVVGKSTEGSGMTRRLLWTICWVDLGRATSSTLLLTLLPRELRATTGPSSAELSSVAEVEGSRSLRLALLLVLALPEGRDLSVVDALPEDPSASAMHKRNISLVFLQPCGSRRPTVEVIVQT